MGFYEDLKTAIDAVIAQYKAAVADKKLTFGEVFGLFTSAVGTFAKLVKQYLKDSDAATRKKIVEEALGLFYDQVLAPIDLPVIPNFVEPAVDKALRVLLMNAADGIYDAIVHMLDRTGWDDVTPDPVVPTPQPGPDGDFKPFKVFNALPA